MTSASELAQLDDEELENRLAEYRRELLNLRFQLATSQLDNYSRLAGARRDVARVLTLMREREIALAEGREAGPLTVPVRPVRRRPRREEELEAEVLDTEAAEDVDSEVAEPDEDLEVEDMDGEGLEEADEAEGSEDSEDSEQEDG